MSSSYRNRTWPVSLRAATMAVLSAAALAAGNARAAETYVQPQLDLAVEAHDNWDLTPGGGDNVEGYTADAQALIGIATQRSDTSVRPRVAFQTFPDEDQDWLNGYLDFKSQYRWQRSQAYVLARYAYEDNYDVQIVDAEFDDFDPENPDVPVSNRLVVGQIIQRFSVAPSYSFDWSERTRIGTAAYYQQSDFDSDFENDYQYVQAEIFGSWTVNPKGELRVAPFASYFDEKDGGQTSAYGLNVGYTHRWSATSGIAASVNFQDNEVTNYTPEKSTDDTSGVGGNLTVYRNGTRDQWRFVADSGWYPSGAGKQETDQLRVQYLRDLTQRLQFNGAARYLRTRAIGSGDDTDDRDFARLELSLRWMMSRTTYLGGGYNFTFQEYQIEDDSAENNQFFLSFGYLGLGRQSR